MRAASDARAHPSGGWFARKRPAAVQALSATGLRASQAIEYKF